VDALVNIAVAYDFNTKNSISHPFKPISSVFSIFGGFKKHPFLSHLTDSGDGAGVCARQYSKTPLVQFQWDKKGYPLVIKHSDCIDGPFIDGLTIINGDFPWLGC
jgi:hypothetical protein